MPVAHGFLPRDCFTGCVNADHQGRRVDRLRAWTDQMTTTVTFLTGFFFIPYLSVGKTRSRSFFPREVSPILL